MMTWGYLFWIWVYVAVVGESNCYLKTFESHGTVGFATYGECIRDGEAIARKGFANYTIRLDGSCFDSEVLARE